MELISSKLKPIILWAIGLTLSVVIVVALLALPYQTWSRQQEIRTTLESERSQILDDISELESQLALLSTDAEIERRARQDFGLVQPGEETYRVID